MTVAENIFVGDTAGNGGIIVTQRALAKRARLLLDECKIRLEPARLVSSLAASQRQLVMIARALSTNPSVLILDESTSSLTHDETENLFRIVRHLQSRGVTTVFITHKMAELFVLADRVTVLRDGAAVGEFERGRFSGDDIVAAMVGRKIENFYPRRQTPVSGGEVLRVEGLTVSHPHIARRNVVEDLSFTVRAGEIVGLAGLVGSGRSETVNAIYGRTPFTGRVEVGGIEVQDSQPARCQTRGLDW